MKRHFVGLTIEVTLCEKISDIGATLHFISFLKECTNIEKIKVIGVFGGDSILP